MRSMLVGLLTVGLVLFVAGAYQPAARGGTQPHAGVTPQLDVELAFDGTRSMQSAIAQAGAAGVGILNGIVSLLPDTHFAVTVLRDHGNPAGEYRLLQPFTGDPDAVKTAIGKIKTSYNPGCCTTLAESYNLAFHKSYADSKMGWRPNARKIVVVFGDAEPNGAGTEKLAGCHDTSNDPEHLSTRAELAKMRAAHRTLIMVREPDQEVSTTLQCYQTLAAGAYTGGVAENAGPNLVSTLLGLIQEAYAPLTLKPDVPVALRGNRSGYKVMLQNPTLLGLTLGPTSVQLPRGFRYVPQSTTGITTDEPQISGRTLSWSLASVVASHGQLGLHFVVHTPRRTGAYPAHAVASIETAAGTQLMPRTPTTVVHVRRRIKRIGLRFATPAAAGRRIDGRANAEYAVRRQSPSSPVAAQGTIVVHLPHGKLVLRARGLRLAHLAAPTSARLTLRVVRARGLRACALGSTGVLRLLRSGALQANGTEVASLRLALARTCGGRWHARAPVSISVSDA